MHAQRLPCKLVFRGRELSSCSIGANVFVLITASGELGVELQSVYLGDDASTRVLVSELAAVPGEPAALTERELHGESGALTYARKRCLYDHLQRLQDLVLETHGEQLRVDGLASAERALAAVPAP